MTHVLEMQHIHKQFPGVLANADVCFSVKKGEVHALLGENGAGKSTLMNILCGLYTPTSGKIYIQGQCVRFSCARDAMAMGIGMVHQHFMLIRSLSVVENCIIGIKRKPGERLDIKKEAVALSSLAARFNMSINPFAKVADLTVGEMQRVEIIKALYRGAHILILDEPTSVLTPQETDELFHMIRELTHRGFTVLFISHKLNEIKEIADRVTVMRAGRVEGTYVTDDCTAEELARLMVGRDVKFTLEQDACAPGAVVLDVQNLCLKRENSNDMLLHNLSMNVRAGEIVGVAGVDGNGQAELVECLTGLRKATSGVALYKNKDLLCCTTRGIMSQGVSHIPQDRQRSGLIMAMPLSENCILQDYYRDAFGKHGIMNWRQVNAYCERLIEEYGVKTPGRQELAQNLSGGNQQKLVVAREISRKPELLVAMHPTRGVDVGAIEYIHERIAAQRKRGVAILLVSTELDEIMKLSDRIYVMYDGCIAGMVTPQSTNREQLGLLMSGSLRLAPPTGE